MTLKKIAAEVGVSISTVSRVVNQNNPKAATIEVQNRIWEVVRQTGYIPNKAARTLKKGESLPLSQTGNIVCVLGRGDDPQAYSFFSSLTREVERAAFEHNYILKHILTEENLLSLNSTEIGLLAQADGVIILGKFSQKVSQFIKKYFNNIVYAGLNPMNTQWDQVLCSGYHAATKALEYLYNLGHRDIGYVGERQGEVRFSAYVDTMKKFKVKNGFITPVLEKHSFELGYKSGEFIKRNGVSCTAILAANDQTAIGLFKGLHDSGIQVPADISVIGIDNIVPAQNSSPQLTTIHIPLEELGKQTFQTLLNRINKTHSLPLEIYLPTNIVERRSCRKL